MCVQNVVTLGACCATFKCVGVNFLVGWVLGRGVRCVLTSVQCVQNNHYHGLNGHGPSSSSCSSVAITATHTTLRHVGAITQPKLYHLEETPRPCHTSRRRMYRGLLRSFLGTATTQDNGRWSFSVSIAGQPSVHQLWVRRLGNLGHKRPTSSGEPPCSGSISTPLVGRARRGTDTGWPGALDKHASAVPARPQCIQSSLAWTEWPTQ